MDWPVKLPFEIAMEGNEEALCDLYGITRQQLDDLKLNPAFRRAVAQHKAELAENGVTFRTKAKLQAESYLENLDEIITAPDTPPSVKLNAIQSAVRWGGLEPQKEQSQNVVNNNVRVEICWGNPETGEVIDI